MISSPGRSALPPSIAEEGRLGSERIAFTGRLATMSRREAWRLVLAAGGCPTGTLSRRTTMLVVGLEGWPILPDGSISQKLAQAEAWRAAGHPLAIVPENVFLESLGLRPAPPATGSRACALEQACRLLGMTEEVALRCEEFGLLRPEGGALAFQDLVSLRSVLRLLQDGMTPAAIARGLTRLASLLPDVAHPLAQLRLIAEHGELLAELQGARMNLQGQLLFDFSGGRGPGTASPLPLPAPTGLGEGADDWFECALQREEDGDWSGARQAYFRALEIDPEFIEAHYNLGNLLLGQGDLARAEVHYRDTLRLDPELACAWYNLGHAEAGQGRSREAVDSLTRSLKILPTYAEAHFTLALCLEELDRRLEAARHWRAFLRLEPESDRAEIARNHLKG